MAVELATAYLSLVPSLRGMQAAVQEELAPVKQAAERSGSESGSKFAGAFGTTVKGTLGAFGVGAVAGGVIAGIHEIVTATSDETAAQARLDAAIRATGGSISDYEGRLRATHGTMEALGFSSAAIDDALSRLVTVTRNPAAAMQDLAVAANIARARNIDLTEAASLVGRVAQGNTGILARYGISLDVTGGKANQVRAAQDGLAKAQQALAAVQDSLAGKTHLTAAEHDRLAAAQQKVAAAQQKVTETSSASTTAMGALSQMFGGQASAYATSFAGRLAAMKAELQDTFAKVGTAALPALQILVSAFAPALEAIVRELPPFAHALADVINFLKQHSTEVKIAAAVIGSLVAIWKTYSAVVRLHALYLTIVERATKAWAIATRIAQAAMAAGPILLVVAAVAALAAIAYVVYRNWGTISAFFVGLWHDITRLFSEGVAFVQRNWQLIAQILLGLTGPIGVVVALVWRFHDQIIGFFTSLPERILAAIEAIPQLLLSLFRGAFDLLLNLFITWPLMAASYLIIGGVELITGLVKGVVEAAPAVWNFFRSLPGRILSFVVGADVWLVNTGLTLLQGLANGIVAAAGAVWGFFLALPGRIVGFGAGAVNWLWGAGNAVLAGLTNGIIFGAGAVWGFLTGMPGRIIGAFGYAGAWLMDAGSRIINGLQAGLSNAFNAIVNWLENLGASIWDHIKKGLGPLGKFMSPKTEAGVMIGRGLGLGILHGVEEMLPHLERASARINNSLTGSATFGVGAGAAAARGAAGPAVVIGSAQFTDQADVEMLMRQAAFALQAQRL